MLWISFSSHHLSLPFVSFSILLSSFLTQSSVFYAVHAQTTGLFLLNVIYYLLLKGYLSLDCFYSPFLWVLHLSSFHFVHSTHLVDHFVLFSAFQHTFFTGCVLLQFIVQFSLCIYINFPVQIRIGHSPPKLQSLLNHLLTCTKHITQIKLLQSPDWLHCHCLIPHHLHQYHVIHFCSVARNWIFMLAFHLYVLLVCFCFL